MPLKGFRPNTHTRVVPPTPEADEKVGNDFVESRITTQLGFAVTFTSTLVPVGLRTRESDGPSVYNLLIRVRKPLGPHRGMGGTHRDLPEDLLPGDYPSALPLHVDPERTFRDP